MNEKDQRQLHLVSLAALRESRAQLAGEIASLGDLPPDLRKGALDVFETYGAQLDDDIARFEREPAGESPEQPPADLSAG